MPAGSEFVKSARPLTSALVESELQLSRSVEACRMRPRGAGPMTPKARRPPVSVRAETKVIWLRLILTVQVTELLKRWNGSERTSVVVSRTCARRAWLPLAKSWGWRVKVELVAAAIGAPSTNHWRARL